MTHSVLCCKFKSSVFKLHVPHVFAAITESATFCLVINSAIYAMF